MIVRAPLSAIIEVDTDAKQVAVVLTIPAAAGEGDVELFRIPVTNQLSSDAKRRLRHLLDATPVA